MIAYKLFQKNKDSICSLFINKRQKYQLNKWYRAKLYKTDGFKPRKGFHCVPIPNNAPHLSNRGREWYKIEIDDFSELQKPQSQGGKWFIANKMKILGKA